MDSHSPKLAIGLVLAALLIFNGIRAIVDPISASRDYGVPTTDATSLYVPVMGARNLALGLAIGTFLVRGDKRAAGTVLCTSIVIGAVDIWTTMKHEGGVGKGTLTHMIGDGAFAAAGLWLAQ